MKILEMVVAFGLSYVVTVLTYPWWISTLKKKNVQQTASEYALKEYQDKQATPMFGGVLFVVIPLVLLLGYYNFELENATLLALFVLLGYFFLGLVDDMKIAQEGKNDGLPVKLRVVVQVGIALVFMLLALSMVTPMIRIPIPVVGYFYLTLPVLLYVIFGVFIMVASANSVNITDGMDGLAAGVSMLIMVGLGIISFVYKQEQLAMLAFMLVGSLLGYLKYNMFPAKIFMGDGGSLALGGLMAAYALLLKIEISYIFLVGVLIWETGCVVIQQVSVRVFKKRVFNYTPIHYSFVLAGWKEKSVVQFIWLLGLIFLVLGLWSALWV
jgi:phospho-N-acetylmuramoyl-pentapeptide-transferase